MSDAFEDQARGLAHSIPEAEISICKELRAFACPETHVLIEAADMIECMGNRQRWAEKRAEAAEEKAALLEQTIQNGAEMIRAAHARAEAAEAERDRLAAEHAASGATSEYRRHLIEYLYSELSGAYDCNKDWTAWSVGTMREYNFSDITDRVEDIADGILSALSSTTEAQP